MDEMGKTAPSILLIHGQGGEGGNGLQHWSQSWHCDHIYITQKFQPCLSCLNGMGGELHFPKIFVKMSYEESVWRS